MVAIKRTRQETALLMTICLMKTLAPLRIVQGGLDAMVATWPLARAVARTGQLGVVSGTLLPVITARRLQLGDPGGHLRRAFEHFPFPGVARRVWEQFFIVGGKPTATPFDPVGQPSFAQGPALTELMVVAGFAEVYLAAEGRAGMVGLHHHGQAPLPLLPSLYGAMLAGVDALLISGGDPVEIVEAVRRLSRGHPAAFMMRSFDPGVDLRPTCGFDPASMVEDRCPVLEAPPVLFTVRTVEEGVDLRRRVGDGLGGLLHLPEPGTAPPSPAEIQRLGRLGCPLWVGGLPPTPDSLSLALSLGAAGLVVSTPFYYCAESELDAATKRRVLGGGQAPSRLDVKFLASPTGFSVPVVQLDGTAADPAVFAARRRFCDVGFLRQVYRTGGGGLGYRCPGETISAHIAKDGARERAMHQRCLCNGMLAALGMGQVRLPHSTETPLVPAGEELGALTAFAGRASRQYAAADVVATLLGGANGALPPASCS